MADRFPLVANESAGQIQEIPAGDNLNLSNNSIVGVGSVTATSFFGDGSTLTGIAATDNINTDSVNVAGVVTATAFHGSGANLTSLPAGNLTGTLPAIDGSSLTGLSAGGMTLVHKAVVSSASTTYHVDFTNLDYDSVYKIIGKRVQFSSPNYIYFRPYLNGGSSPTSSACEYNYTYYYNGYSNGSGDWTLNDGGYYSSSYGYNVYFEFDFSTGYFTWAKATGHYFRYQQSMCDMWGWLSSSYIPYSSYRVSGIRIHNGSSGYYNADSEILLYKYNES